VMVMVFVAGLVTVMLGMVAMLLMLMVMVMLVLRAAAAAVFTVLMLVVMMVMVVMLMLHGLQLCAQGVGVHGLNYLLAADIIPGGGDKAGLGVESLKQLVCLDELFGLDAAGAAENDEVGRFYLVVEKFAEVAHIHFALGSVHNGELCAQLCAFHVLNGGGYLGKLAHAGGFNNNTVGIELSHDLLQGLGKIAHQRAADAAGVELVYLNACVLEETAVNGNVAEFVFNKYKLFALVALCDELADESGLAGAQKAGENIYSCHVITSMRFSNFIIIHLLSTVNNYGNVNCLHCADTGWEMQ